MIETAQDLGARIALARAEADFTQEMLAARSGIDRSALAKAELGARKISALELVRIANAVDRPVDWFLIESPQPVVSRRSSRTPGQTTNRVDEVTERLARDVDFLVERKILSGRRPEMNWPLSFPNDFSVAVVAASTARRMMGATVGPLVDVQAHAEALGLYAFSFALGQDSVDGASIALDSAGVALVNASMDPGRRRFTLAHELGHYLFNDAYSTDWRVDQPGDDRERMIDAFAAHLLMPRESVSSRWNELAPDCGESRAVAVLASEYRVSVSAMAGQLANIGVVPRHEVQHLAGSRPTRADFVEFGLIQHDELADSSLAPQYRRAVLGAFRRGLLGSSRCVDLLHGAVESLDLPERDPFPLESLRGEL